MAQISPVPLAERTLSGADILLLWSGAAISLAEIWAGGALAPLGLAVGLGVVALGHLVGNLPLSLGGWQGAKEGLPAMVLTRSAVGRAGSYLAAGLNITQLVGWTAVMCWLAGQAGAALAKPFGESSAAWWIVVNGVGTTLWALAGHRNWRWLNRLAGSALLLLCGLMTWVVLTRLEAGGAPVKGGLGFGLGLDLVIAMPISWLPLVADYARFARTPGAAAWGTYWGYFLVSSWMYALGLGAAVVSGSATPEAMIMALLAHTGWLGPALAIVVLSTITTTFLDVYSAAVSGLNLPARLLGLTRPGQRAMTLLAGGLGTVLALVFQAAAYEPFLLFIGSFFCPLYGVVLVDYFLVNRGRLSLERLTVAAPAVNPAGLVAWALGFGLYRAALAWDWPSGASLPSMILAGLVYLILAGWRGRSAAA